VHAILALDFTTILELSVARVPCMYSVFLRCSTRRIGWINRKFPCYTKVRCKRITTSRSDSVPVTTRGDCLLRTAGSGGARCAILVRVHIIIMLYKLNIARVSTSYIVITYIEDCLRETRYLRA
jgi:hypothetical protein